jgi:Uma2 family endonuclease
MLRPMTVRRLNTAEASLFAIPETERFHELIAGELVRKAMPSGRHGTAQLRVGGSVRSYDRAPGDRQGPGGWRFASEVEIRLEVGTVVRPDVAGWRRERLPAFPQASPIVVRPDWVCEVLSLGNAARDLWDKLRLYHHAGVPHYWVLDPDGQRLRVHRFAEPGYQVVLDVGRDAAVRVEPFEHVELTVAGLFDDDD